MIKSKYLLFFALFEKDMNRHSIEDQNNVNIIDEPKDIFEVNTKSKLTLFLQFC